MQQQGVQARDPGAQRGPVSGGTSNASPGLQPAASPPACQYEYGSRFASGFLRYLESGDLADVVVVVETDEDAVQSGAMGATCAVHSAQAAPEPQAVRPSGHRGSSPGTTSNGRNEYRLHGLLLAHHSAFFAAALGQQHFADSAARRIRLSLDPAVAAHWPDLVRYFYTDGVALDDRCALPLLALARQLLVPELDAACADYVRRRLCGANCLAHLRAAVRFALHDLHSECVALAAQAFPLLYASPDLCGLPPASLLELLTAPGLQVHCELQVAEAVVRYLASTHVEPEAARALCAQIRFPYLDNATITRLAVAADPGHGLGPGAAAVAAAAAAGAAAASAGVAEACSGATAGPSGSVGTGSSVAAEDRTPEKADAPATAEAQAAGTPGRDGSTGGGTGGAAGGGAGGGESSGPDGGTVGDSPDNDDGDSLLSPSADTSAASSPAVSGGGAAPGRPTTAPGLAPHQHQHHTLTTTTTAAAAPAPTSPVPRDLALEGALARLAAMEFAASGKMMGGFPHPLDPHAPPGALAATGPSHPLSLGGSGGGGGASATAAAAAAATVAAASPGRRPLAFFRSMGGGGGGGAGSGPQAHALALGPSASGGGASSPGSSSVLHPHQASPQHPHQQAGSGSFAGGVAGGGAGDGAAAAYTACSLVPPPRPSYCSALAHGLPGGAAWVDVALEALWEHLVPYIAVQVSGCGEGSPAHVTSSDPDCFFETNDSAEPLPWIEVILPRNVHVLQLHRYTFMHGHRRAGYYRARNFKTQIAARPAVEPPLPGAAHPPPQSHHQQQQQGPPSSSQQVQGGLSAAVAAAGVARSGGATAGPVHAGGGSGSGGDLGTRYVDVPTRMTEQFDVSVMGGGGSGNGGGSNGGLGPWRCLRLQATGAQEDGVHRLCVRALRMYGTARIDLMQQAGGFVVQPAWVLNARVEAHHPHPLHPHHHHHPHSQQHHGAGGPGGSGGYGGGGSGGSMHGGAGGAGAGFGPQNGGGLLHPFNSWHC